MVKKRMLLQISNTIIANLNNADGIGFLYGKIGLALFMYRYSRFVNNQYYENIADEIVDDIYSKMNDAIPRNYERGLAGIGCAMCRIIKEKYVEGDPSEILESLDEQLLCDIKKTLIEDMNADYPIYSSGLYLLDRLSVEDIVDSQKEQWIFEVIDAVEAIDLGQIKDDSSRILLISSILFVLFNLSDFVADKCRFNSLYDYLLKCALLSINSDRDINIALLKKITSLLPEDRITQELLLKVKSLNFHMDEMNENLIFESELNWYWLFNIPMSSPLITKLNVLVDKLLLEIDFDLYMINSKLAKIGTWTMKM